MNRNNQQGFTLIELVMVIVILGILAATALPKFVDMGSDARKAALQGAYGAINSTINIVHSKVLVSGATSSITMEDGTTVSLSNGYPATSATGIAAAVTLSGDLSWDTTNYTTVNISGAATAANCKITYTAATSSAPASVAIVDTGC